MGKEKVNKKETLKIPIQRVRKFFPASYTTAQIEEEIVIWSIPFTPGF